MRSGVDGRLAPLPHVERWGNLHDPSGRFCVRGPRDLPSAVVQARVLPRQMRAKSHDVAFGLQIEDRDAHVGPDAGACRRRALGVTREALGREAGGVRAAAVHEVAVEDAGAPMERIDVRDKAECRLRPASGQHVADAESAQRILPLGLAQRLRRLREDVVREGVPGMDERSVAHRIPGLQTGPRCIDPDGLCTNAHPGVALSGQQFLHLRVVRSALELRRDVQPLDDEHAVESASIPGPANQHPHRVRRGRPRADSPHAIHTPRRGLRVSRGGAGEKSLLLDVPGRRVAGSEATEGLSPAAAGDRC